LGNNGPTKEGQAAKKYDDLKRLSGSMLNVEELKM
jgi:hypothetical protein